MYFSFLLFFNLSSYSQHQLWINAGGAFSIPYQSLGSNSAVNFSNGYALNGRTMPAIDIGYQISKRISVELNYSYMENKFDVKSFAKNLSPTGTALNSINNNPWKCSNVLIGFTALLSENIFIRALAGKSSITSPDFNLYNATIGYKTEALNAGIFVFDLGLNYRYMFNNRMGVLIGADYFSGSFKKDFSMEHIVVVSGVPSANTEKHTFNMNYSMLQLNMGLYFLFDLKRTSLN